MKKWYFILVMTITASFSVATTSCSKSDSEAIAAHETLPQRKQALVDDISFLATEFLISYSNLSDKNKAECDKLAEQYVKEVNSGKKNRILKKMMAIVNPELSTSAKSLVNRHQVYIKQAKVQSRSASQSLEEDLTNSVREKLNAK